MRRRAGFAAIVALVALLPVGWLAGCGGEPAPANGVEPERSRLEEMEWAELDCSESATGPAGKDGGSGYVPLLPEPGVDGLYFSGSGETEQWKRPSLVVYGEPECEDPAVGRLLGAHVEPGEDGALDSLACHGEGSSKITLHGMPGRIRQAGDTHWVCWEDSKDLSFAARTEFAVFGRGIPAAAVLRAAKAAEASRVPGKPGYGQVKILTIPTEARPPGLRKLARGSFSLAFDSPVVGRRLSWSNRHAERYVAEVVGRANAKDVLLARVAVVAAGGRPVRVRGALGLVARERRYDGYLEQFMTWQEGNRLVFVETGGLRRSELDEFVSRLAPASEADVNELSDSLLHYPPDAAIGPGGQVAAVFRRKDRIVVVDMSVKGKRYFAGLNLITAEDGPDHVGTAPGPSSLGDGRVLSYIGKYVGYAAEKVDRVELEAGSGTVKQLPLKETRTPDKGRYFPVDWDDDRWTWITAYDADGNVLQRELAVRD